MESASKRSILHQFARNANIEGINNAGRAPTNTRLMVWLTIFVFLVALTINDVVQLVQEYLSNPVDVATTLEHENTVDFPSVTICNMNIVHCGRLKRFIEKCDTNEECKNKGHLTNLQQMGKCEELEDDKKIEELLKDFQPEEDEKVSSELHRKKENYNMFDKETFQENLQNQNQSLSFKSSQDFLLTYLKLTPEEKSAIGHQLFDLVKDCTFRGVDCMSALTGGSPLMDYEHFLSPKFGNCYTIYARNELMGKSSLTGADYGLSFVLNIEHDAYLKGGMSMVIELF